jgi:hypothetical protein
MKGLPAPNYEKKAKKKEEILNKPISLSPFLTFIQGNPSRLLSSYFNDNLWQNFKIDVSRELFTGVFCPDVQPAKERREDV